VCYADHQTSNALALILVTGFVTYLTRYHIQPEERILQPSAKPRLPEDLAERCTGFP
jgi:hypothetical protein